MGRPTRVQITRHSRTDRSTTFGLRVRIAGGDESVALGNSKDGWDEIRAETARRQLLAKIELGLWTPAGEDVPSSPGDEEPTFRELATDWLRARRRNPAIAPRTTELNESQLSRYLAPFFGELLPSEITTAKVKEYRERIHVENEQIRRAADGGQPLRDARTGQRLRTLSNESINKTLLTLAQILDEAEDAGWVQRNVARGRRTREPLERRRNRGTVDVDELVALLEAAGQLDGRHKPQTLERAALVRDMRDHAGMEWGAIAQRIGVGYGTAISSTAAPRTPMQPHAGHAARSWPPLRSRDPASARCAHSTTRTSASPKPAFRSATQRPKPASARSTSTPGCSTS
jgi:hypothetical protein